MSRHNPNYPPVIQYLNSLKVGTVFTFDEFCKALSDFTPAYLKQLIIQVSTKEFYIGKLRNTEKSKIKIIGYVKHKNIPTDKGITDIYWFLKYKL